MKYLCNVGFIMLLGFSAQGQIDTLRSGFGGVVTISGLTQLDSLTWDVTITSSNWKGAWNPVANSEFAFTEVSVGDNFFVNCTVFRVNAIADPVPGTVKTLTVSRPSGIGNDPLLALNAAIFDRTSLQKLPRINRAVTEPGEIGLSREDYECLMNDFIARVEQNSVDAVRRDSTYQIAAIEDTLALSPIQGDRFVLLGQNLMGMYDSGAWVLIPIGGDGVFYYWTGYNAEYELPLDTLAKYDRVLIFTGTLPSDTTIITLPDINSDTQYDGKIIEVRYASGPGSVTIVESDDGIYRYNCIGYGSVEPNLAQDILTAGLYDLVRYTVAGSANYLRHCPIQDGGTGGISDTTSFVVYAPAHGLSDSITAYGYVPVMPGYFKANSSSQDSIHFAYAVGAPHVDSLILKLSGAITVTGHGLTINKLYYLNDDGTESQVQGTFRVPTVYVIDANTLLLTEVGSNESYLLEAKAYADSLFAVADSLREAGDRSTPILIQAFDRIIQLDGCSTSETVITGFQLIDDTAIDEGAITFEIGSPQSITYDVYNADSTSYYFETSVSRAAGIYTWEVGYTDPDGNFVGDMNSFEVIAGTPDTVTVPLNDSVFVTRRCGVEIRRDTIIPADNVTGTGASPRVALWSAAQTLTSSANLTYTSPLLTLGGTGASLLLTPTSAPVNAAGKWYTSSGNYPHFMNGTTDWPLVRGSTESFTPGSLLFAGTSGQAQQDNTNLFFDDTNNRLRVGSVTSTAALTVSAPLTAAFVEAVRITDSGASAGYMSFAEGSGSSGVFYPTMTFRSEGVTEVAGLFYALLPTAADADLVSTTAAFTIQAREDDNTALETASIFAVNNYTTNFLKIEANGKTGISESSPQRTLHVAGEMRVTDLTTDTPTRIVGADADGDFGEMTAGTGISFAGGQVSTTVTDTHLGNADLTASGNRAYNLNGNSLRFRTAADSSLLSFNPTSLSLGIGYRPDSLSSYSRTLLFKNYNIVNKSEGGTYTNFSLNPSSPSTLLLLSPSPGNIFKIEQGIVTGNDIGISVTNKVLAFKTNSNISASNYAFNFSSFLNGGSSGGTGTGSVKIDHDVTLGASNDAPTSCLLITGDFDNSAGGTATLTGLRIDNNIIAGASAYTAINATSGNVVFGGTGGTKLHSGTTAQRPGTPVQGQVRANTDNDTFEGYDGTKWQALSTKAYTPTSTADSYGSEGDITYDDDYIYIKTSAGWKRSALSTF